MSFLHFLIVPHKSGSSNLTRCSRIQLLMQQKWQLPSHLLHRSLSVLSGIGVHTQQTAAGLVVTRLILGTSERCSFQKSVLFRCLRLEVLLSHTSSQLKAFSLLHFYEILNLREMAHITYPLFILTQANKLCKPRKKSTELRSTV